MDNGFENLGPCRSCGQKASWTFMRNIHQYKHYVCLCGQSKRVEIKKTLWNKLKQASELTSDQYSYLQEKIEKKRADIIQPHKIGFGLNRSQCIQYFNIINDTFSKPLCRVEKVEDDQGYVRAWFTGSGIMSHPVKYAWVPLSVIQDTVQVSLIVYFYFKIKNILKQLFFPKKGGE